jgi:hypothetical protein
MGGGVAGGTQIVSNKVRGRDIDSLDISYYTATGYPFSPNHRSTVTCVTSSDNGHILACARVSDSDSTAYMVVVLGSFSAGTGLAIYKIVLGATTHLVTANPGIAANDTISCEAVTGMVGGLHYIRSYKNGTLISEVTDRDIATGFPGMGINMFNGAPVSELELDDWTGTDLGGIPVDYYKL